MQRQPMMRRGLLWLTADRRHQGNAERPGRGLLDWRVARRQYFVTDHAAVVVYTHVHGGVYREDVDAT